LGLLIYLKFYGVDRTLLLAEPLLFIVLEILFSLHIDKFINVRINKLIEFLKKLNEDNEKVKKK